MSIFRRKASVVPSAGEQLTIKVEASSRGDCYVATVYGEDGKQVWREWSYSNESRFIKHLTEKARKWIEAEEHRRSIAAQGVVHEETVGMPRREALQAQIERLERELDIAGD